MRRTGGPTMWLVLALVVGLAGCDKQSTAPDPNAAVYGTWSGVYLDTVQTPAGPQPQQHSLHLQIGPGGVGCTFDGIARVTAVELMRDPDVSFVFRAGAELFGFSGTRTGDSMSGKGGLGATWTVARVVASSVTSRSP